MAIQFVFFQSYMLFPDRFGGGKATSIKLQNSIEKSFKQKLPIFDKSLYWHDYFIIRLGMCCVVFFYVIFHCFASTFQFLCLSIQFRKSSRASLTFYSVCWNLYDLIFELYFVQNKYKQHNQKRFFFFQFIFSLTI